MAINTAPVDPAYLAIEFVFTVVPSFSESK